MSELMEAAKSIGFINSKRTVNIRGYAREVTVTGSSSPHSKNYWYVLDRDKLEMVHVDDFYHRANGMLIPRDVEFKRKYPDHDFRIENLPTL